MDKEFIRQGIDAAAKFRRRKGEPSSGKYLSFVFKIAQNFFVILLFLAILFILTFDRFTATPRWYAGSERSLPHS
jgi:hypothetical protein